MADPNHVKALLEEGPWSLRNIRKPDLSNANLSGKVLRYFKAAMANLTNTAFRGADLRESSFVDAKCNGADFTGANLEDSTFFQAELNNTIFKGANLKNVSLVNVDLNSVEFEGADLKGVSFKWSDLDGMDLSKAKNVEFIKDLEGANLEGTKGIPLKVSAKFKHEGETLEEKASREEEERLRREEEERLRREEEERLRREEEEEERFFREEEEERLRREEEKARREEERLRRKAIQDVTKRVSRAKKDKELEALAHDVGTLQAQPEYVKEYGKVLNDLQAKIEEKYSVVGKGRKFLKRLFSRGRRASQIRVASRMNRELQREIRELKRDLRK